jgi:hypothetical protein
MFIFNKYYKIYHLLCERAKSRQLIGYTEKHHIIPRSFGGTNSEDNIAILTAREHYIAHLCLHRCTIGKFKKKMGYALYVFKRQTPIQKRQNIHFNSVLYARLKEEMFSDKTHVRRWTQEEKQKMSIARKGKSWGKHTNETKSHLRETAILLKQIPPSQIGKTWKLKTKRKSISPSTKHRENLRNSMKAFNQSHPPIKLICPHCFKEGIGSAMYRHHFDRCKHRILEQQ